jgi:hypothetical protein
MLVSPSALCTPSSSRCAVRLRRPRKTATVTTFEKNWEIKNSALLAAFRFQEIKEIKLIKREPASRMQTVRIAFASSREQPAGTVFDKCSVFEFENSAGLLGFPKKDIKDIKRETRLGIPTAPAGKLDFYQDFQIQVSAETLDLFQVEIQDFKFENHAPMSAPRPGQPQAFRVVLGSQKGGTAGVSGGER